jgi:hypothetical protein
MKTVYVLTGKAKDQETIVRQRPWYESYVGENITGFSKTNLVWNMNGNGQFDFKLEFYD